MHVSLKSLCPMFFAPYRRVFIVWFTLFRCCVSLTGVFPFSTVVPCSFCSPPMSSFDFRGFVSFSFFLVTTFYQQVPLSSLIQVLWACWILGVFIMFLVCKVSLSASRLLSWLRVRRTVCYFWSIKRWSTLLTVWQRLHRLNNSLGGTYSKSSLHYIMLIHILWSPLRRGSFYLKR